MPNSYNPYSPPKTEVEPDGEPEVIAVAGPPQPRPTIPEGDDFVTAFKTTSLVEAEMLTQMLEGEGIATPGFSKAIGAAVGLAYMSQEVLIRVPSSQLAHAQELIEAFQKGLPVEEQAEDDEPPPVKRPSTGAGWQIMVGMVLFALLASFTRACR